MGTVRKRVLVADDDESIVASVQAALQRQGYEVMVARDGTEALARIERDAPDLVVLDVIMPRRSGFSVLEQLRRNQRRSLKIVLLTANDEPRHREFAASRGVDLFIAKPFELEGLILQIDALLTA